VSWATERYDGVAAAMDGHLVTCGMCRAGLTCPDGDDVAEAEYRAYRDLQEWEPGEARVVSRRGF
jgi:hypothetical protein